MSLETLAVNFVESTDPGTKSRGFQSHLDIIKIYQLCSQDDLLNQSHPRHFDCVITDTCLRWSQTESELVILKLGFDLKPRTEHGSIGTGVMDWVEA